MGCARPTGGSHTLTTRGPAQRGEGAKAKGRAQEAEKSSETRAGVDPLKTSPARKWRVRGRIEQMLLDGDVAPTDLRPSPATTPYHKSDECFYLRQRAGAP